MNKRRILAIAMSLCIVAILAVGASLAYFTDTKSATNTFSVGNVKIALIEQEKTKEGLEDFTQDKTLVPGKSNDGNAVSKIVTVENTGKNDAWVWVDLKIPTYLVSKDYPTDESKNALHWNSYGEFNVEYNGKGYDKLAKSDGIIDANGKVTNTKMVDVAEGLWYDYVCVEKNAEYTLIRTKMQKPLPAGKISLPCLAQTYMDWRVTADGDTFTLPDGSTISTSASWKIDVTAYAIQVDGFATIDDAIAAYANNGK